MMVVVRISANAPCPCGRRAKLKHCCGRIHQGRPASPPGLVRARYTAYALGLARFIIETTDPTAPHYREDHTAWRAELRDHAQRVRFEGLEIHDYAIDEEQGTAWVSFTVRASEDGRAAGFSERSRFLRDGNRWRYVDGDVEPGG